MKSARTALRSSRTIKNNNGFTLVELIVIVIVIAIISSLVVIGYRSLRIEQRETKRAVDAVVVTNAIQKYFDQNGVYPAADDASFFDTLTNSGHTDPTDKLAWNYKRNPATGFCDGYPRWGGGEGSGGPSCRNYGYSTALSESNTGFSDNGQNGPGCLVGLNPSYPLGTPWYVMTFYSEKKRMIIYTTTSPSTSVTFNAASLAFPGQECKITDPGSLIE